MGPQTVGAFGCASHRFRRLADSDDVWRSFLHAHWPAFQVLCANRSSKACYAYRIQLTRDAAKRCSDRDHVGLFSEEDADGWMAEEASKYQLIVEMVVGQKVLLACVLDLSYDVENEDICAHIPASCNFCPVALQEFEDGLRVTLTLLRKHDGKCLVVGDRMEFVDRLDDGSVILELGSSPIDRTSDAMLYVLSKHPICNMVLRHRDEHWFMHEAAIEPVHSEDNAFVSGISQISIGLHGVCSLDETGGIPGMVFAVWDELATWA